MNATPGSFDPPGVKNGRNVRSPVAKILHAAAVAAISLTGALIFSTRVSPTAMDYVSYWSAGTLLLHHADPYSPAGVLALEKAHGFLPPKPLVMRNPPWALFLAAPLGFFSLRAGLFLWTLVLAACILGAVHLLNPHSKDTALSLLFAPSIACIGAGQSSPFLLLGFALFLYLHQKRPFLAGASLLLMAIKPHLFLVFWAVLLADCVYRRSYLILAGWACALAAGTVFTLCFAPHIWPQYNAMFNAAALGNQDFPTASTLFRILIDRKASWLLFIPSAVAVLWGLWYFARWRHVWDWRTHGMLLMLVSVFAAPYSWFTDEVVLLPAIIFALNTLGKRRYSGWVLVMINSVAALIYLTVALAVPLLIWTPLAWLAWFLYATYTPRASIPRLKAAEGANAPS
jgi:hypothetical protein